MAEQCGDVFASLIVNGVAEVEVRCSLERSEPRNHRRHEASVILAGRAVQLRWTNRYDLPAED